MFKIACSKKRVKSKRGASQPLAVGPKESSQLRAALVVQLLARSILTPCTALSRRQHGRSMNAEAKVSLFIGPVKMMDGYAYYEFTGKGAAAPKVPTYQPDLEASGRCDCCWLTREPIDKPPPALIGDRNRTCGYVWESYAN